MAIVVKNSTLKGLKVQDAYRKQVVRRHTDDSVYAGIHDLIRYKVNAILVHDDNGAPAGVVTKTDIMGAYYAELPVFSRLSFIMNAPVIHCRADENLDTALQKMKSANIHGLYVTDSDDAVTGVLSYSDIVGLLYQYCHKCKLSKFNTSKEKKGNCFKAREVMSNRIISFHKDAPLTAVMEALSASSVGGTLITDGAKLPLGTVSKTDLVMAYKNKIPRDTTAGTIMSTQVVSCPEDTLLKDAIHQMILSEIQRIFIYRNTPENISGVLSLSDSSRFRSGSCHACTAARITVDKYQ